MATRKERVAKFKMACEDGTIQNYLNLHYRYVDIAKIYGVSASTVCVYATMYNLSINPNTTSEDRPSHYKPKKRGRKSKDNTRHPPSFMDTLSPARKLALTQPWIKQ